MKYSPRYLVPWYPLIFDTYIHIVRSTLCFQVVILLCASTVTATDILSANERVEEPLICEHTYDCPICHVCTYRNTCERVPTGSDPFSDCPMFCDQPTYCSAFGHCVLVTAPRCHCDWMNAVCLDETDTTEQTPTPNDVLRQAKVDNSVMSTENDLLSGTTVNDARTEEELSSEQVTPALSLPTEEGRTQRLLVHAERRYSESKRGVGFRLSTIELAWMTTALLVVCFLLIALNAFFNTSSTTTSIRKNVNTNMMRSTRRRSPSVDMI